MTKAERDERRRLGIQMRSEGVSRAEVARLLGVGLSAVSAWTDPNRVQRDRERMRDARNADPYIRRRRFDTGRPDFRSEAPYYRILRARERKAFAK